MWYVADNYKDKTWKESLRRHLKIVNDKKNSILKRIRSYTMLVVADTIDTKTILPVREAFDIYSQCMKEELSTAGLKVPDYKYRSSDARDLFMCHLPVIMVYGKDCGYIVKK